MSSGIVTSINQTSLSYSISKVAVLQLVEYVAAEYHNVNADAIQPGIVDAAMVIGESQIAGSSGITPAKCSRRPFKKLALDTPELVGAAGDNRKLYIS